MPSTDKREAPMKSGLTRQTTGARVYQGTAIEI